ncbi:VOC family protein [Modestobacter caceresii]|uniref:VOC family protein n=1 Tax=Modestobacter caceresii TaxID=1522368 RepID=UPI0018CEA476|nr:VOC family protein [Modestobacter caceresii]
MRELGFGQPRDGIIQMAYVVADVQAAIEQWTSELRVGPWFLLDSFTGVDPVYRGQPSRADVAIAMAFAGHMQIELIQPKDEHPSVYREVIEQRGHGFHHFGVVTDDIAAGIAELEARGHVLAYRAGVPTGGEVAYLDGGHARPGMVELIEYGPGMDAAFTAFWRASLDWDGADPIRPFAAPLPPTSVPGSGPALQEETPR